MARSFNPLFGAAIAAAIALYAVAADRRERRRVTKEIIDTGLPMLDYKWVQALFADR